MLSVAQRLGEAGGLRRRRGRGRRAPGVRAARRGGPKVMATGQVGRSRVSEGDSPKASRWAAAKQPAARSRSPVVWSCRRSPVEASGPVSGFRGVVDVCA